jgi:biopolymer transport protein ExbD
VGLGFFTQNGGNGTPEVNMTPLIDVSLVLVVMLLLTTPLAFESNIGVDHAAKSGKRATEPKDDPQVEIVLVSEDVVRVNRSQVSRAALTSMLTPLLATSEDRGVTIACEPGVTHGAFVDVLDQAKLSGAGAISVIER